MRQRPREIPLFIEVDGEAVYSVLHTPPDRQLRGGIVICSALAEEGVCARRVYVNAARQFCNGGWAVLRADVRGEGDSARAFDATDLDTRVSDVAAVVNRLRKELSDDMPMALVGHRLGASIALRAAACLRDCVSGIVIWDPIYSGKDYFMNLLRSNVAAQLANAGRVSKSRADIVAELGNGGFVVIEGYVYRGRLVDQLMAADLTAELAKVSVPTLVMEVSLTRVGEPSPILRTLLGKNPMLTGRSVTERAFWKDSDAYVPSAPNLSGGTLDWLCEGC